ncbi:TPA: hypothetical protein N0F65_008409 [Lagenidium giganteum]|uniref:Uncharacterized protein n=1 Tax=Lagenidium giganteum TaxID=4803 RepID=A0AAV2Z2Y8_9STRA|nr:TPA: hypothetical protein N0F65_008409 [Lagenidium giganteum]
MDKKKADRDDDSSGSGSSSSSSENTVLIPKSVRQKHRKKLQQHMLEQRQKQHEDGSKSVPHDQVCVACEHEGGTLFVCSGPCVSSFHLACLNITEAAAGPRDAWVCPRCLAQTHECFHCHAMGAVRSEGAESTSPVKEGLKPVRKCRALSCGKFYHHDCITKLPLARIAGTHFICPLHTCGACEQSGAKMESVRCTRCPVAYHTSCLPKTGVTHLTGKRIICPKHANGGGQGGPSIESHADAATPKGAVPQRKSSTGDADTDGGGAASPAASADEQEEDERAEGGDASGSGSKKHSKKSKSDKKKKKKKRKKGKKREGKDKGAADDAGSEKGEVSKADDKPAVDDDEEEKLPPPEAKPQESTASAPKEPEETKTDATTPTKTPLVRQTSSSLSDSSLFDSPVVATERIKARLVEVLGQSDDDSEGSPIVLPQKKDKVKTEEEEAESTSGDHTPASTAQSDMKPEPSAPESAKPASSESPNPSNAGNDSSQCPSDYFSTSQSSGEKTDQKGEKKAKKEDRSRSKGARQSLFKDETAGTGATDTVEPNDNAAKRESKKHALGLSLEIPEPPASIQRGSKGTASEGEDGEDDEDTGGSAPNSKSAGAGDTGKGKLTSRSKKKKKPKRSEPKKHPETEASLAPEEVEEEEEDEEEAKWVQCDECKKWRLVPRQLDLNSMPERWYCHMNYWDKRFASCAVAEEVVEKKLKKRSSSGSSSTTAKRSKARVKGKARPAKSAPAASSAAVAGASAPGTLTTTALSQQAVLGAAGIDATGAGALAVPYSLKKSASLESHLSDKSGKKIDKQDKQDKSKKRKLKLKLKEKYREVKWVQCENAQCAKWRVVPSTVDFNMLPATWFCNLNTWATELAKCNTPNPPEVEAFLAKTQSHTKRAASARPAKRAKTGDNADQTAASSGLGALVDIANTRPAKHGKGLKFIAGPAALEAGAHQGASAADGGASLAIVAPTGPASAEPSQSRKAKPDVVNKTVLEWAQCEKCNKWRKLPHHIKSSTLPDKWYCSMNHWDPARAACSIPEEVDQEPVDASPLPSSQNWYPMPGQVSGSQGAYGTVGGFRSKRGKLSYSELLYASTGQLRKTYTAESSTLSFEYEGTTNLRDDQYKDSSMYVSTSSLANSSLTEDGQEKPDDQGSMDPAAQVAPMEELAPLLLDKLSVRKNAIADIVDQVNERNKATGVDKPSTYSLAIIVATLNHLVHKGEVEKVEERVCDDDEVEDQRKRKKKKTGIDGSVATGSVTTMALIYYRRLPKRPLKASKLWKHGEKMGDFND